MVSMIELNYLIIIKVLLHEVNKFERLQEYALVPPRFKNASFANYMPTCAKAAAYKQELQQYNYKSYRKKGGE